MLILFLAQSLISALVFFLRRPFHISNIFLAIWFLINALNFAGLMIPNGLTTYIKIGYLPFLFLNGPLLYLYIQSLIKINFKLKISFLLHLLPFVFISIYRLFNITWSVNPSSFYEVNMPLNYLIIYILISISILGYLTAIFISWVKHRKNLFNYFANTSQSRTLTHIIIILSLFAISSIFEFFAPLLPWFNSQQTDSVFWFNQFNLGMFAFILLIAGLLQSPIFIQKPINTEEKKEENIKYQRSGLTKEQLLRNKLGIIQHIETNKPYLNPDYNLEMMARDLNISRQNLSQTINDELNKNFYQLINEYRANEFKKYLNDPKMNHITFLGLAYEAGFNSKSSFYRVFKEITGETPSEYRKKINRKDSENL